MTVRVHPTATVEHGVTIGSGSTIWDNVHIRAPTSIGSQCIVGEKSYIAYGVSIGDRVKINAFVYICAAVTIERGAMIAAGTIFTNDRNPRATTPDLTMLHSSAPDDHTRPTTVREGATVGARCVVGCDLEIGRFAMVGMGSVVTRSVPDFHLVVGHPARSVGMVCRCAQRLRGGNSLGAAAPYDVTCSSCGRHYRIEQSGVVREQPDLVHDGQSAKQFAR